MDGVKYQTPDHLQVVCFKCTRSARIRGNSEEQANRIAQALGWRENARGMVCPKCPGGAPPNMQALSSEFVLMQAQAEAEIEHEAAD